MGGGPQFSYEKEVKRPISAIRQRALKVEARVLARLVDRAFNDFIKFMQRVGKRKGMDSERFGQFISKIRVELDKYEEDQSTFFMG